MSNITCYSDDFLAADTGDNLFKLIEASNGKEVFCLDGSWGSGKSHFCREFKKKVENEDYKCIYFDAFKNDYQDDPLISLLGEISALSSDSNQEIIIDRMATLGKFFLKGSLKAVIKGASRGIIDLEKIEDGVQRELAKELSESTESFLSDAIKDYGKKEESLFSLKKEVEKLALQDNSRGLVFIVDELDRCKPSFSIELIEKIKHIFECENVVFLLSMHKPQVQASIRHVYGCSAESSEQYLNKFISLTVTLPNIISGYAPGTSERNTIYQFSRSLSYEAFEKNLNQENAAELANLTSYYSMRQNVVYRDVQSIANKIKICFRLINHNDISDISIAGCFMAAAVSHFSNTTCFNSSLTETLDTNFRNVFSTKKESGQARITENQHSLKQHGVYKQFLMIYAALDMVSLPSDGNMERDLKAAQEQLGKRLESETVRFCKILAAV